MAAAASCPVSRLAGEPVSSGMDWWWGELPWLLVRGGEGKGGAFAGQSLSSYSFMWATLVLKLVPTNQRRAKALNTRCSRHVGWWIGSGYLPGVATVAMAASAKGAPGLTAKGGPMVSLSKFNPLSFFVHCSLLSYVCKPSKSL